MYNWRDYNKRLVRRGEILISEDILCNWHKELAVMNRNKRGRRYQYPNSFIKILGYAHVYFGLPYRQTEGLIRTYHMPEVPDYTVIHKRVNRLDIKQKPCRTGRSMVLAIDSSGIKITNRGDWMHHKWKNQKKGFLKIHVGVDTGTKQILAARVTDQHSHDSRHLKGIVRTASRYGTISKVLGDGAFDSRKAFSFLDGKNIIPAIRVRRNSVPKSGGCYPRKKAVMEQLADYSGWCHSVSYGQRWMAESVFSSIKRMFGEEVRSRKRHNMIQEMMLKISLYNMFVAA